jgi:hypothetical protein
MIPGLPDARLWSRFGRCRANFLGYANELVRCWDSELRVLRTILLSAAVIGQPATTWASGHELDRSALRQAIEAGDAIPFYSLQDRIEQRMDGALVDVSLYNVGALYYRVIVRQPNGRIVSAVVDARTGGFVPVSSPVARTVQDTARSEGGGRGLLGLFSNPARQGGGAPQSANGAGAGGRAANGSPGEGNAGGAGRGQSSGQQGGNSGNNGNANSNASGNGQSNSAGSNGSSGRGGGDRGADDSSPAGSSSGGGNAGNGNAGGGNGNAGGNGSSDGDASPGNSGGASEAGSSNAGGDPSGNANAGGGGGNGNASEGNQSANGNGQGRN